MEEEKLKLLLIEKNFDICMNFLAQMIEKYGDKVNVNDVSEKK